MLAFSVWGNQCKNLLWVSVWYEPWLLVNTIVFFFNSAPSDLVTVILLL